MDYSFFSGSVDSFTGQGRVDRNIPTIMDPTARRESPMIA
jgi:hypothetical protein